MHDIYEYGFTTPQEGETDAGSIQAAIDLAKKTGLDKTVIPRYNKRTGALYWTVDTPVKIPSDFVLELDNCEVRFLGEGAFEIYGGADTYAERVWLSGTGNAKLSGGETAGRPLVFIENARQVTVCGLNICNQATRGILCRGVSLAVLRDIWFSNDLTPAFPGEMPRNAKGITVACGCDNLTIENIFGTTIGSTVEITTFSGGAPQRCGMLPRGCSPLGGSALLSDSVPLGSSTSQSGVLPQIDGMPAEESAVRDIFVKNVRSDSFVFPNVCLVNGDGKLLCNVVIDGVTDLSKEKRPYRARTAVSIGETVYGFRPSQLGEMRNITVKNVASRGACAVELVSSVQDITIGDITVRSDGGAALGCGKTLSYHNIYLCNVKFDPRMAPPYPIEEVKKTAYIETPLFPGEDFYPYRAVCNMRDIHGFNFKINGVYADMVDNLLRITGKNHIELYDVDVANIVYDDFVGDDCTVD